MSTHYPSPARAARTQTAAANASQVSAGAAMLNLSNLHQTSCDQQSVGSRPEATR